MESVDLNWLAIIVAAVVAFIGGALWYSPVLFAKPWMRLTGVTEASPQGPNLALLLVGQAIITLIAAVVLASIISWANATELLEGVWVGLIAGAGLVAADQLKLVLFERRPLALFAINNGYTVLAFIVMGAILAVWD